MISNDPMHTPRRDRTSTSVLAALLFALLTFAGCASDHSTLSSKRPGQGLVEYRQLIARARTGIDSSLRSLDTVTAQTPCPPKLVTAFSDQIDHLTSESVQIRARSQAIQT